MGKIFSYERRIYESVDDKNLLKTEFMQQRDEARDAPVVSVPASVVSAIFRVSVSVPANFSRLSADNDTLLLYLCNKEMIIK